MSREASARPTVDISANAATGRIPAAMPCWPPTTSASVTPSLAIVMTTSVPVHPQGGLRGPRGREWRRPGRRSVPHLDAVGQRRSTAGPTPRSVGLWAAWMLSTAARPSRSAIRMTSSGALTATVSSVETAGGSRVGELRQETRRQRGRRRRLHSNSQQGCQSRQVQTGNHLAKRWPGRRPRSLRAHHKPGASTEEGSRT